MSFVIVIEVILFRLILLLWKLIKYSKVKKNQSVIKDDDINLMAWPTPKLS